VAGTWSRHTAPTVAAYIAALPADQARSLRRLRDAILAAAPGGREVISYRVPGIVFPNGARIHFGARRGGLSLYPGYAGRAFAEALDGFKVSGTTIHFTPDHEIPVALIKRIARRVIAERTEASRRRG
jgi:uncharacterized protein YdhG (YjbR/CyaY superfamily)